MTWTKWRFYVTKLMFEYYIYPNVTSHKIIIDFSQHSLLIYKSYTDIHSTSLKFAIFIGL